MMIRLKDNLMSDPERKAAVEKVASVCADHKAKLKEAREQIRLALAGVSILVNALDEQDTVTDGPVLEGLPRQLTPADHRKMRQHQLRLTRTGLKVDGITQQISDAESKLLDLVQALGALGGELSTAMQQYAFSKHAPAPLPFRAQRQAQQS